MLSCVYQHPIPLSNKNCFIKVNRDTRKMIVSKFTEGKGGRVKVEVESTHKTLNQLLHTKPKLNKNKNHHHHHSHSSLNNNNEDSWESAYSSDSEPLSETCGLSISELEAMAARQARQLETQEQLLAAKAQRLRFLKSSGEADRLQRLREKVASQEERLRKLRSLRGKVQSNRNGNSVLSADLESLRAVFNEKEKELSLAVAKVDELTRQLEDIRRNAKDQPQNGQSAAAALELEKLRRELMYRHKLRESQTNRVSNQKQALSQRQEDAMRVDRRIAELQERLHRKRVLNSQLAATLKHQENVEDFVSLPTKNDPKYQTLPYNAKLFAPFANKHEQDQFEKSMQQMQLDHPAAYQFSQNNYQNQQHANNHANNAGPGLISNATPSNADRIQSYNAKNSSNNFQQQLNQFLSQQQQSNNNFQQVNSGGKPSSATSNSGSSSSPVTASSSTTITTTAVLNSLQTVNSNQANHNVSWGKAINPGESNTTTTTSAFPIVRPSNFLPTGAPASSPDNRHSFANGSTGLFDHSVATASGGGHVQGSNAMDESGNMMAAFGNDAFGQSGNQGSERHAKPALPPKPAKPTPPPRQAQDIFSYGQRLSSSSDGVMYPERTELSKSSKPAYAKYNQQNMVPSPGSGSPVSSSSNVPSGLFLSMAEKESSDNAISTTVRVSMNRRIEMPPAFLFPESDPPPSDLVPEHPSSSSSVSSSGSDKQQQQNAGGLPHHHHNAVGYNNSSMQQQQSPLGSDSTDASPMLMKAPSSSHQFHAEEYTLPDLFPNPPPHINLNHFPVLHQQLQQGNNGQQKVESGFPSPNNNNSQQQSNFNPYEKQGMARDNAGGNDQIENQQESNESHKEMDSHVSVMKIHVGTGSPRAKSGSEESGQMSNNSNQLESFEAVEDNERNSNEQSSERKEKSSDTNPPSNSNVPGVLRRVKKSNFKSHNREHIPLGRRVSFDPLALLLDASLEGELDLVMKTASEVGNVSAANDEGITALHNAICAGHAEVVRFLVEFGCDVNAQDSDGWTPLHCAASCNNVGMVKFLVEHGACIFATTLSDHETAAEKCEEDEDGYGPCSEYLYSIQEKLGIMNGGVVYAVFEYDSQNPDEMTFREGDRLMIIRKGDEYEREWWWAALTEKQGYVPRNLLGLYPRVVPQKRSES